MHHVISHMNSLAPNLPNPQTPKFALEFLRSTVHDVETLPQTNHNPDHTAGQHEVPQGRPSRHHHPRPICRQEGRHHPARRQRQQASPLRPRRRRRHRALPLQDHAPHVQDPPGEAIQDQALHQGDQLQPPDAHTVHPRAGGPQGRHLRRDLQGGFPARGCEEDGQDCVGGSLQKRQEPLVLYPSAILNVMDRELAGHRL